MPHPELTTAANELVFSNPENLQFALRNKELLESCGIVYFEGSTPLLTSLQNLNPRKFRLISSRFSAPIKEQGIEDFSKLPEPVKNHYLSSTATIELTQGCTVACHFCRVAEKGEVKSKLSWNGFISILDKFKSGGRNNDFYYYRTDPLEWHGIDSNHTPKDYVDIGQIANDLNRGVFTSTALPLGEELTFLRLINYYLANFTDEYYLPQIRSSRTANNALRRNYTLTLGRSNHYR